MPEALKIQREHTRATPPTFGNISPVAIREASGSGTGLTSEMDQRQVGVVLNELVVHGQIIDEAGPGEAGWYCLP